MNSSTCIHTHVVLSQQVGNQAGQARQDRSVCISNVQTLPTLSSGEVGTYVCFRFLREGGITPRRKERKCTGRHIRRSGSKQWKDRWEKEGEERRNIFNFNYTRYHIAGKTLVRRLYIGQAAYQYFFLSLFGIHTHTLLCV